MRPILGSEQRVVVPPAADRNVVERKRVLRCLSAQASLNHSGLINLQSTPHSLSGTNVFAEMHRKQRVHQPWNDTTTPALGVSANPLWIGERILVTISILPD